MVVKVLVVGGGGREHAIVEALSRSETRPQIFAAPGNPGMEPHARRIPVAAEDLDGMGRVARQEGFDLAVIGPEAPLALGLADRLTATGVPVFGPTAEAAKLEASKLFAKQVMDEAGVPTAAWAVFEEAEPALAFARSLGSAVVKADGLAAGKGVYVPRDEAETEVAIRCVLAGEHGDAGRRIVVEERLEGEELSVMVLCDGQRVALLPAAQDYKRLLDGDEGPNTGGMGAYSPPAVSAEVLEEIRQRCIDPVVAHMADRGTPFQGVLYAGLMLTAAGPRVLEFNVRLGDPEAQAILPRIASDPLELMMAVAHGRLEAAEAIQLRPEAAVVVVLAAQGYPAAPSTGDRIQGLDRAALVSGVRVFHAGTRREAGDLVTAGGRVLGVLGMGADIEQAAKVAYAGVREISFAGMQVRSDIGARGFARRADPAQDRAAWRAEPT